MASRYRQDMQRAWSRIAAIPTGKLETRLGTVEYPEQGAGQPSWSAMACSAAMPMGSKAGGPGCRGRVPGHRPVRFGYFGSTLPPHATPADQAEAYALLLDHLGSRFIDAVVQLERR